MRPDQTNVDPNGFGLENSDAFAGLECIHTQLRHAVEDQNYDRIQDLLAQQRAIFDVAGPLHPKALQHALLGRDMASWALTMVRLQHAHHQRALFELVAIKKASESYAPLPVREFACLAEG